MPTILAIDDDQTSLVSLSVLLPRKIAKCRVITASSGQQGIEMARTEYPDTIILDINMPIMDGFEVCKSLKSDRATKHIPVIILTGFNSDSTNRAKCLEHGADAFLAKPVCPMELTAQVNAMLRIKTAEVLLRNESDLLEQQVRTRTTELVLKNVQLKEQMEERQKVTDALGESEEKYRSMMEALGDGVYICSPNLQLEYMNPAMIKRTGRNATGEYCHKALYDLHEKCPWCIYDKVVQGKSVHTEIVNPVTKRTYQLSNSPIFHLDGTISKLTVSRDVTEITTMEEEKAKLLSQLTIADKMASIGQLAAGVAHEINNPVGFVTSNLNALDDYLSDIKKLIVLNNALLLNLQDLETPLAITEITEKIESFAHEIGVDLILEDIDALTGECKEGLERIKNIVVDLKNFAHPGKEKTEDVDINTGIESTLNVISNELKYKAEVTTNLGTLPFIRAVSQQLNQVFLNILVNAAHSINGMGKIAIKTWHENNYIYIRISDTGCGIPEENIKKIFGPFFTTKKVGEGTGLGMNIAYNIIEKHQGKIDVKSKVGQGTTFTVSLPVNPQKTI